MFESIYRDANGLHIAYSKSNRNIPDVQWVPKKRKYKCSENTEVQQNTEAIFSFRYTLRQLVAFIMQLQKIHYYKKRLPEHVFPSPIYPVLQAQVKFPIVFVQLAFESHDEFDLHSSTSVTQLVVILQFIRS